VSIRKQVDTTTASHTLFRWSRRCRIDAYGERESDCSERRLLRVRLQLRENLSKYFSKQTHLVRAQLIPSGRRTGRNLGLVAERLRNAMDGTHSINVADPETHAAIRTAVTNDVDRCLNNV